MDLNKIGLAVGTLALFLSVPLAVIANLLTPYVREWYVGANQRRMKNRLDKLTKQLESFKGTWTFTGPEWAIYMTVIRTVGTLIFGWHVLWSLCWIVLGDYKTFLPHDYHYHLHATLACGYFFNLFLFFRVLREHNRLTNMHSVVGRQKLASEAARLTTRLANQGLLVAKKV
jgi:hypothetical protein